MKNILRKKRGFTLIELLVVIAVIGVLAGAVIAIINPSAQLARARNAKRKNDLKTLANAIDRYFVARGSYPITTGNAMCGDPASTPWPGGPCGADWIPGLVASGEIKSLPKDPKNLQLGTASTCASSAGYSTYAYQSNGIDYKIMAHCTPEGDVYSASDPFWDPARTTWSWAIYTPGAAMW